MKEFLLEQLQKDIDNLYECYKMHPESAEVFAEEIVKLEELYGLYADTTKYQEGVEQCH